MIEAFSGLLSSIKQTSPVIFTGLAIASGIVLFGSGELIETIGLNEFRDANTPYIGGCFVLSLSIVFAQSITGLLSFSKAQVVKWQKSRKSRKLMELRKADLVNLTPNEKAYLAPYIFGEETTQYFLMEDGIKGSLEARNILYRASNMGDMVNGWAYNIQPWARDHLRNNPHLLEGFTPNMQRYNRW
ncbi:super-infection exclusion protein B [Halomonas sp. HL-93]|uniref:super-infection exclusion protein B n=1 Tax=Halomonas sp. HL-93 TaxID=1666906 RepID=UPI0006D96B15|nr:super-infection exclusion protein B [Halomonas sp. HL-93]KPQ20221.1 MAG: Superinfection exclusion protein B [Halomonas sp. HL-93]SBR51075.1 Superinfection exclusion protein B [Halomonas sp. HL-93]